MRYKCPDCGHTHKPTTIEFYNVCPQCKHKSSTPLTAHNRHPIHDY